MTCPPAESCIRRVALPPPELAHARLTREKERRERGGTSPNQLGTALSTRGLRRVWRTDGVLSASLVGASTSDCNWALRLDRLDLISLHASHWTDATVADQCWSNLPVWLVPVDSSSAPSILSSPPHAFHSRSSCFQRDGLRSFPQSARPPASLASAVSEARQFQSWASASPKRV